MPFRVSPGQHLRQFRQDSPFERRRGALGHSRGKSNR
jgi:hypothetical protein